MSTHATAQDIVETFNRVPNQLPFGRAGHICVDDTPTGSLFANPNIVHFVTGQTCLSTEPGAGEEIVLTMIRQSATGDPGTIDVVNQIELNFGNIGDSSSFQPTTSTTVTFEINVEVGFGVSS